MKYIQLATLLLSIVGIAVCADHGDLVQMFPCGQPQPRVHELEEIFDQEVLKNITARGLRKDVFPPVAVLHRCHSSGYCKDVSRCAPMELVPVTMIFSVWDSMAEPLTIQAMNETVCGCKLVESNGKELTS